MSCVTCGGTMIGDGYTSVTYCEFAIDTEYLEPDAGPIYCAEPDTHFHNLFT